eukprot:SAG11_NODE_34001_length_274_cov_0.788571_1_plen_51_part_10
MSVSSLLPAFLSSGRVTSTPPFHPRRTKKSASQHLANIRNAGAYKYTYACT